MNRPSKNLTYFKADKHPDAHVIGVDLSPIQYDWCVDQDCILAVTFGVPFDGTVEGEDDGRSSSSDCWQLCLHGEVERERRGIESYVSYLRTSPCW